MNRRIRIHRVAGVLAANDGGAEWNPIFDAPRWKEHRLCLDRDWRGVSAPVPVRALLVLDDAHLHLAVWLSAPPWTFADAVPGRFRPGLWQRDLVELFLCGSEGDGYREYHLSPGGEWWMSCFSAPRVPVAGDASPGDVVPGVPVFAEPTTDGWRGVLSLPRHLLPPGFAQFCEAASYPAGAPDVSASVTANLTAIVGGATRHFLSVVPLPGERPDFHQPPLFPSVLVSPLDASPDSAPSR